jgi:hypothetical protein
MSTLGKLAANMTSALRQKLLGFEGTFFVKVTLDRFIKSNPPSFEINAIDRNNNRYYFVMSADDYVIYNVKQSDCILVLGIIRTIVPNVAIDANDIALKFVKVLDNKSL